MTMMDKGFRDRGKAFEENKGFHKAKEPGFLVSLFRCSHACPRLIRSPDYMVNFRTITAYGFGKAKMPFRFCLQSRDPVARGFASIWF